MKKSHIIAIVMFFAICFSMFFVYKYATRETKVDEPVVEVPLIDEPEIPQIDEPYDDIIETDIGFEEYVSTYCDENDEVLVNCSATLPKSDEESEFADNFNEYYAKVLTKVEAYRDYEGSDLAEEEKTEFLDDFQPINYVMSFELMYEDDEIVSIKRDTIMYSNETDFHQISTETFSKIDGTLILVTDICPDIISACEQYFKVSLSSLEDFKFNVTSEGIWCKIDEIDEILPYSEINLAENYKYLGENDAAD